MIRIGNRFRRSVYRAGLGKKDLPPAAQYAPGEHFGTPGGRGRKNDLVYLQGRISCGTGRRCPDAAAVLLTVRRFRDMDVRFSFSLSVLQCRI